MIFLEKEEKETACNFKDQFEIRKSKAREMWRSLQKNTQISRSENQSHNWRRAIYSSFYLSSKQEPEEFL